MAVVAAAFDGVIDVTEALGLPSGRRRPSRAVVPTDRRRLTVVLRMTRSDLPGRRELRDRRLPRPRPRPTAFDLDVVRRRVQRLDRPGLSTRHRRRGVAGRHRPRAERHPAGDGRRARLQPPGAAPAAVRRRAVRRLHGLRQRLPRQRDRRDRRSGGGPRSRPSPGSLPSRPTWMPPRRTCGRRFVRTKKYADVPERNGVPPGRSGCSSIPTHCKGCGECVEVCASLGHDALFMTDKVEASRRCALDDRPGGAARCASSGRCRRHPPSIGTTRRSPTSCSASMPSATSAAPARVPAVARGPRSG